MTASRRIHIGTKLIKLHVINSDVIMMSVLDNTSVVPYDTKLRIADARTKKFPRCTLSTVVSNLHHFVVLSQCATKTVHILNDNWDWDWHPSIEVKPLPNYVSLPGSLCWIISAIYLFRPNITSVAPRRYLGEKEVTFARVSLTFQQSVSVSVSR